MTWRNDQAKTFKSVEFLADYVFSKSINIEGLGSITSNHSSPHSTCELMCGKRKITR